MPQASRRYGKPLSLSVRCAFGFRVSFFSSVVLALSEASFFSFWFGCGDIALVELSI